MQTHTKKHDSMIIIMLTAVILCMSLGVSLDGVLGWWSCQSELWFCWAVCRLLQSGRPSRLVCVGRSLLLSPVTRPQAERNDMLLGSSSSIGLLRGRLRGSRCPRFAPTAETSDYPPVKALLCNCENNRMAIGGEGEDREREGEGGGGREEGV